MRPTPIIFSLLLAGAASAACSTGTGQQAVEPDPSGERGAATGAEPPLLDPASAEIAPLVARADEAIGQLAQTLMGRLGRAMAEGGPHEAIGVCAEVAQPLTGEVAEEHGLDFGRTSHRVRNQRNEPRAWVEPWLARYADGPAAEAAPAIYDLGDRIGVVRPIGMQPLCITCHGESIEPALLREIEQAYPEDRARGFAAGELRGAFWAEVPRDG